jgi:hypothetical protein
MSVASVAQELQEQGGGSNVKDIIPGIGIDIIDQGGGTFRVDNLGIVSATAGTGIDVTFDVDTGDLTIDNTGGLITSLIAGDGIAVSSETGDIIIGNTGILSATDGDGISITTTNGILNIENTGILGASDYAGISSTTVDGVLNINNTGVINITAGKNITITGGKDDITINDTGVEYNLGYATETIGPITLLANGGNQGQLGPFAILNYVANPNTTVIISNKSTNALQPITYSARVSGNSFVVDVANFSDVNRSITFPFSLIAITPK